MCNERIQMVDLTTQYLRLKKELDEAMQALLTSGAFINGPQVPAFARHLAAYLQTPHVVPCANGTDALRIAFMRLDLRRGDEVIMPAFAYAAAAESAILAGLTPVLADVDSRTFNLSAASVRQALTERTRAILPVHLFGQSCDMQPLMEIARQRNLFVVEDNAQSLGSAYTFADGSCRMAGTMGDVGILSFFPTKILGCFGDGGALIVPDEALAEEVRITTVHGQSSKYHHRIVGCNSRLDTLQAALLDVKLSYIDAFIDARRQVAAFYDGALRGIGGLLLHLRQERATHVWHQYTPRVKGGKRDALQAWLKGRGIPSAVYYPLAICDQEAFRPYISIGSDLTTSRQLPQDVLSLPIHTEMTASQLAHITQSIADFFRSPEVEINEQ